MYRIFIKRLLDIILSIIGLILLVPIIIIVSPIIWLEDKGSVFYNAIRTGKNGKTFKMYKFRTMRMNCPDIRNRDGSTYNNDDDPRLTKIGKVLRKTSIDELPQIINVLKGDMSLIGPRPLLPAKFDKNTQKLIRVRSQLRPGITGYSQAYYRNSISQKEKIKQDIYYVNNISFILDIKILIKTIKTVFMRENIYNEETNNEG